jgi:hypothetical protein
MQEAVQLAYDIHHTYSTDHTGTACHTGTIQHHAGKTHHLPAPQEGSVNPQLAEALVFPPAAASHKYAALWRGDNPLHQDVSC